MKSFLSLLLLLALAAPVYAASETTPETGGIQKQKGERGARGGFKGPISGAMADTVAKALELTNEAPVLLTGSLQSKEAASKNIYIFKDETGEIRVKMERNIFGGNWVTPETKIRIGGEIEKEAGKNPVIDVKNLEIVN